MWSVGYIFEEIIHGQVILPGLDYIDQWNKIVEELGTPSREFLCRFQQTVKNCVESRSRYSGYSLDRLFPPDSEQSKFTASVARDLLGRILVIDPEKTKVC